MVEVEITVYEYTHFNTKVYCIIKAPAHTQNILHEFYDNLWQNMTKISEHKKSLLPWKGTCQHLNDAMTQGRITGNSFCFI